MEKPSAIIQVAISSLLGLIVLNCVMLGALFAQVAPNPPGKFGPYIGTTIALAVLSLPLVYWRNKIGYICSIIVGLMCLMSLGPHKLFIEKTANEVIQLFRVRQLEVHELDNKLFCFALN
jgi:hypothetical protein